MNTSRSYLKKRDRTADKNTCLGCMTAGAFSWIPGQMTDCMRYGGTIMNANVNYIGMVNLLLALQNAGIISEMEARKIAARLRVETGADVIYSPQ